MRLPSGIFPTNLERLDENHLPSWSQSRLQEAIELVITQQLRFTQTIMRGWLVSIRRQGFRWCLFTQKHNIISLYYQDNGDNQVTRRQSFSPENLLNLPNNKPSLSINIPFPSNHFLPFLSLTSQSRHSMNHLEYKQPHTL